MSLLGDYAMRSFAPRKDQNPALAGALELVFSNGEFDALRDSLEVARGHLIGFRYEILPGNHNHAKPLKNKMTLEEAAAQEAKGQRPAGEAYFRAQVQTRQLFVRDKGVSLRHWLENHNAQIDIENAKITARNDGLHEKPTHFVMKLYHGNNPLPFLIATIDPHDARISHFATGGALHLWNMFCPPQEPVEKYESYARYAGDITLDERVHVIPELADKPMRGEIHWISYCEHESITVPLRREGQDQADFSAFTAVLGAALGVQYQKQPGFVSWLKSASRAPAL